MLDGDAAIAWLLWVRQGRAAGPGTATRCAAQPGLHASEQHPDDQQASDQKAGAVGSQSHQEICVLEAAEPVFPSSSCSQLPAPRHGEGAGMLPCEAISPVPNTESVCSRLAKVFSSL